jgi:hypothetical protein
MTVGNTAAACPPPYPADAQFAGHGLEFLHAENRLDLIGVDALVLSLADP